MKILIFGLNYAPEKVGIAVYTTGMAEELVAMGHDVKVVSGQPYYPAWKTPEGYRGWAYSSGTENGVKITRTPHYVPSKPSGAKRLIHHASFGVSGFFPMAWTALTFRPDIVITVAPSLIASPVASIAAFLSGAKSWLHIQDFEVEAAFATGLLDGDSMLSKAGLGFERGRLKSFDRVSSISPQMCQKLTEKGVLPHKIFEFRNWADIGRVTPMQGVSSYRDEWGIQTEHVALYSGNIANKQGIDIVVDAAKQLSDREDITFVVCGEGPNRANLEQRAAGLTNIQFHDLQPFERLNDLMGLATIHLLPQLAGAADLVLPSKLTNMLASGKPVVATADPGTGLADEVEGCGLITTPGDVEQFALAIAKVASDAPLRAELGSEARMRAEERWAKNRILSGFNDQLIKLVNAGKSNSVTTQDSAPEQEAARK